eukprot:TRINITY_DN4368_c0_g2_i1.p1 TRINITY_DN4368_c0_g2~~TRINITY_DN4368_c0_g2_i1.p1  ORF type:complete len:164 (+),score=19.51 TRINITY_DN4368_c0_g2_i1:60-551(+)
MFFDLLQQWQVACKILEWGKHKFSVQELPRVLSGGDDGLDKFHEFLEVAAEAGFSIQDLTVMHPDDLTQVFNECNAPAATRVVVRRVVTFPCTAMDGIWNICKVALMAVIFSTRCINRVLRPVPLAIMSAIGAAAVLFVQQNPRHIANLTEHDDDDARPELAN